MKAHTIFFTVKIIGLFLIFISNLYLICSGQSFYYSKGEKVYYVEDSTSAIVIIPSDTNILKHVAVRLDSLFYSEDDCIVYSMEDDVIFIHSLSLPNHPKDSIIDCISNYGSDSIAFFSYTKMVGNERLWFRNELLIKIKDNYTLNSIDSILQSYPIISIELDTLNEYIIHCQTETGMLNLANALYETGFVDYSLPDYYGRASLLSIPPTDPLFKWQYYLYNSGQIIPNEESSLEYGSNGMDIKAIEAWKFLNAAIGNIGTSIKVAVIDDGVECHEDLVSNGECRVLDGWTCGGEEQDDLCRVVPTASVLLE